MSTFQTIETLVPSSVRIRDRVAAVVRSVKELAIAVFELLCELQTNYEVRQRMVRWDDRMLRDIGRTREEVEAAAKKSMWQR